MNTPTRDAIERFSERVGRERLLTQAAGGNVSWKDGNTLWVKSSGAWLENARREDMFVPMDLAAVRRSIDAGTENYIDHRIAGSILRPSIETGLHASMPQAVVAHLHAVDALVHAAMRGGRQRLAMKLDGLEWEWVPYRKPGLQLASQVASQLRGRSAIPDVLVLANHGVVFCAATVDALEALVATVVERLYLPARATTAPHGDATLRGFRPVLRRETRALACDPVGVALATQRWVLYPDHAVFLGAAARVHATLDDAARVLADVNEEERRKCPCVVVPGHGVWLADGTTEAAERMLDCYADVCLRIDSVDAVVSLTDADIDALLKWEAEAFRKRLSE